MNIEKQQNALLGRIRHFFSLMINIEENQYARRARERERVGEREKEKERREGKYFSDYVFCLQSIPKEDRESI